MSKTNSVENVSQKNIQIQVQIQSQPQIKLSDLLDTADRVDAVISSVRETMLEPDSRKKAPSFTTNQVAQVCGLDRSQMQYRIRKGDLPNPTSESVRKKKTFSLKDTVVWSRSLRSKFMRPDGAEAIAIAVANFKGGVTKTTTAVTLAQGLSLRGHKVLVIDMDPQASLTSLFGLLNEDIDDEETLMPLCYGNEVSADYAIRKTYWDGIDIIPANLGLYAAEFALPARQKENESFDFWNVVSNGIDSARVGYDAIIIDTSPSLSYLTINALFAADAIIMPVPPNTLDFTSSGQFWNLFNDLATNLIINRGKTKSYEFVDVLLAKVDSNDTSSVIVRKWIQSAYGDMVLPVEIPRTSVTAGASAEFGTVYDAALSSIDARTYRRAFEAYERVVELVEGQIIVAWARQMEALKSLTT